MATAYFRTSKVQYDFVDNYIEIVGAGSSTSNRLTLSPGENLAINYQSLVNGTAGNVTITGFSTTYFTSAANISLSSVGSTGNRATNTGVSADINLTLSFPFSYNDPDIGSGSGTASCTLYIRIGSPIDQDPDPFTFTDASSVVTGNFGYSNVVTVVGINAATPVTASVGITFSIAGGAWVTTGNISNGQTLQVRMVKQGDESTPNIGTVTVGSYTTNFRVYGTDTTPDNFVFGSLTNLPPFTTAYSNNVVITGISVPVSASLSGGGAVMFVYGNNQTLNAVTSATIYAADTIYLRMTSPNTPGASYTCTLTVGSVSRSWTITNSSADPNSGIKISLGPLPVVGSNIITLFGGRYDNWYKARNLSEYVRGGFYVPNIPENNNIPTSLPLVGSQFANAVQSFYKLGDLSPVTSAIDSYYNSNTWVGMFPVDLSLLIGYGNARNNCDFRVTAVRNSGVNSFRLKRTDGGTDMSTFSPDNKTFVLEVYVPANQADGVSQYTVTMEAKFKYGSEPVLTFTQVYSIEFFNSQL